VTDFQPDFNNVLLIKCLKYRHLVWLLTVGTEFSNLFFNSDLNLQVMKIYLTELDAIYELHKIGYTHDFQMSGNDLLWIQEKILVRAGDFVINEYHEFIDHSRKGAGIIVFGVVALYHNVKGILIRHYTTNTLKTPPVILKKIRDRVFSSTMKILEKIN
jgi:hypothetical protein